MNAAVSPWVSPSSCPEQSKGLWWTFSQHKEAPTIWSEPLQQHPWCSGLRQPTSERYTGHRKSSLGKQWIRHCCCNPLRHSKCFSYQWYLSAAGSQVLRHPFPHGWSHAIPRGAYACWNPALCFSCPVRGEHEQDCLTSLANHPWLYHSRV